MSRNATNSRLSSNLPSRTSQLASAPAWLAMSKNGTKESTRLDKPEPMNGRLLAMA
eukprot:CAMPEP_0119307058 /NCGR_PEP_ID=MMETSP1333-20130426/7667_1 /TAXON_ID=418940 /ORGANISM="Scyphosphaera apsteinii, Strain RCC1455" /LENGTH=55 /DNA_ID=CAMNT_0007310525 /DNA_START=90 /DNA_END=254 /DNA_ORIENTATION=-